MNEQPVRAAYEARVLSVDQYARFLIVGAFVGIITILSRELFARFWGDQNAIRYSVSVIAAYAVGILLSFLINGRFTFRSPTRGWSRFPSFVLVALVGLVVTWLLSLILRFGINLTPLLGRWAGTAAFAVATLTASLITYPLNALLVFRESTAAGAGVISGLRLPLILVLFAGLLPMWASQITTGRLESDATESTRMAVNLAQHGVMSLDSSAPYTPTNFREPLPVAVTALGVGLIDRAQGRSGSDSYLEGPRAKLLKYQNLLWLILLTVGAFIATRMLTGSFWFGIIAVVLVNDPMLPHEFGPVDNLLTEIPAAAILIWASLCLVCAFKRQRVMLFCAAGLLFGLVTLTKAIMLHVFLGLLLTVAIAHGLQRTVGWRRGLRNTLVLCAGFLCVVAPWMWRNQVALGTMQLTQRGAESLWERALEDQVSAREYEGAFFLWARPGLLQRWLGRWGHFSLTDAQLGGSLVRLNSEFESPASTLDLPATSEGRPDKAVTFFRQGIAENERLKNWYASHGAPHPDIAAEKALYREAIDLIVRNPLRHLALFFAFLWRGAFVTFPMLVAGVAVAGWCRRGDLALFLLPALGVVLMYGAFTPFFPRYSWPSHLVAMVGLVIGVALVWEKLRSRLHGGRARVLSPGMPSLPTPY